MDSISIRQHFAVFNSFLHILCFFFASLIKLNEFIIEIGLFYSSALLSLYKPIKITKPIWFGECVEINVQSSDNFHWHRSNWILKSINLYRQKLTIARVYNNQLTSDCYCFFCCFGIENNSECGEKWVKKCIGKEFPL